MVLNVRQGIFRASREDLLKNPAFSPLPNRVGVDTLNLPLNLQACVSLAVTTCKDGRLVQRL